MKKIISLIKLKPEFLVTTKGYEEKLKEELNNDDISYMLIKFIRSLAKFEFNYISDKTKTLTKNLKNVTNCPT